MEAYNKKKLSAYSINVTPSDGDLIPSIVDNGNGTFTNYNIPYSTLKGAPGDPGTNGTNGQGVPAGGTTDQFLRKTSGTDFATAWTSLTKSYVGLANVDNTADTAKPVSTAQATAIATAKAEAKSELYPVGSIYINASVNTNPGTLLGFGTWVAFGAGRVPVGIDSTQTEFDVAEETGGAKTHTLTTSEIPSHTHRISLEHGTNANLGSFPPGSQYNQIRGNGTTYYDTVGAKTEATGGGGAHNNLQPYIVVYMWKRTA